jgi:hypothetical protein
MGDSGEAGEPKRTRLSKKERKQKKVQKKATQKLALDRKQVVLADDGTLVQVETKGFTFRSMPHELVVAANRFSKDYGSAYPLRCVGFEPGVDEGRSHSGHVAAIAAQRRLRDLRAKIGERSYTILLAVVIIGAGPADLHAMGGPQIVAISEQLRLILKDVSEFYSGVALGPDKLLAAAERVVRAVSFDQEPERKDLHILWGGRESAGAGG